MMLSLIGAASGGGGQGGPLGHGSGGAAWTICPQRQQNKRVILKKAFLKFVFILFGAVVKQFVF